jgi:hypothetical protein
MFPPEDWSQSTTLATVDGRDPGGNRALTSAGVRNRDDIHVD